MRKEFWLLLMAAAFMWIIYTLLVNGFLIWAAIAAGLWIVLMELWR